MSRTYTNVIPRIVATRLYVHIQLYTWSSRVLGGDSIQRATTKPKREVTLCRCKIFSSFFFLYFSMLFASSPWTVVVIIIIAVVVYVFVWTTLDTPSSFAIRNHTHEMLTAKKENRRENNAKDKETQEEVEKEVEEEREKKTPHTWQNQWTKTRKNRHRA